MKQKRMRKRYISMTTSLFIMLSFNPYLSIQATEKPIEGSKTDPKEDTLEGWQYIENRWYYYIDNKAVTGWQSIDGDRYYMDQNGATLYGEQTINQKKYYFDHNARLKTGWIEIKPSFPFEKSHWVYAKEDGAFVTGWQEIDGTTYYFDEFGYLFKDNIRIIDGKIYAYDSHGKLITKSEKAKNGERWQHFHDIWIYLEKDNHLATGWKKIDGKWYYFNSIGKMLTGIIHVDGKVYLMDANGDWIKENGLQTIYGSGIKEVDGKTFYFQNDGSVATGYKTIDSYPYFFDDNGVLKSIGEAKYKGQWVRVASSGYLVKGWYQSGTGEWYYYDKDGYMKTGWLHSNDRTYYLNEYGIMMTGWQYISNKWHYFNADGEMIVNKTIDGYKIDKNGVWTDETLSEDKIHYINIKTRRWASDAILIQSQNQTMLVDCPNAPGEDTSLYETNDPNESAKQVLDYLENIGVTHIDYIVMTHHHGDHIGGIPYLSKSNLIDKDTVVYYRTNRYVDDIHEGKSANVLYQKRLLDALDALKKTKAEIHCLDEEGITQKNIQLGKFDIEFLNLDNNHDGKVDFYENNGNNNSIVLKVTKGSITTLLTGDIERDVEQYIEKQIETIDVLKAPHHSQETSSSDELLNHLNKDSSYIVTNRKPMVQYTLNRLYEQSARVYALDEHHTNDAIVEVVNDDSYEIYGTKQYTGYAYEIDKS